MISRIGPIAFPNFVVIQVRRRRDARIVTVANVLDGTSSSPIDRHHRSEGITGAHTVPLPTGITADISAPRSFNLQVFSLWHSWESLPTDRRGQAADFLRFVFSPGGWRLHPPQVPRLFLQPKEVVADNEAHTLQEDVPFVADVGRQQLQGGKKMMHLRCTD